MEHDQDTMLRRLIRRITYLATSLRTIEHVATTVKDEAALKKVRVLPLAHVTES
jgi:hypothetical protein